MDTRRGIIAVSGLFLFSTSATRVAISIRILARQKPTPPFTVDQEKSKEAVLAKAAIAKL